MAEVTMTSEIAKAILNEMTLQRKAEIFQGSTASLFEIQTMTLDLSTARAITNPLRIGFPFKSLFVRSATDNSVAVTLRPLTADSYQSGVDLRLNDSLDFDQQQASGFLSWSAQSGKSITLVFFVNASFKSGSQVSQTAGGVAIVDGSSFTRTVTTLAAATATSILASDTTRKICSIQNNTGGYLYVGDSTITDSGSTIGLAVAPGAIFQWRNTAQLYGYSVLGGPILLLSEF
jgi:hypothetical protein